MYVLHTRHVSFLDHWGVASLYLGVLIISKGGCELWGKVGTSLIKRYALKKAVGK